MNTKILSSVMAIGVALMLGAAGGMALFSDTETSGGNEFVAGTLDISLGSSTTFTVKDAAPGVPETTTVDIADDGTINAELDDISVTNVINWDDTDSSDYTYDVPADTFDDYVNVRIWLDTDGDDGFTDESVDYDGTLEGLKAGDDITDLQNLTGTKNVKIELTLDSSVGNNWQNDGIKFDLEFYGTQEGTGQ